MKIKNKILVAITAATLLVTSASAGVVPTINGKVDCSNTVNIINNFIGKRISLDSSNRVNKIKKRSLELGEADALSEMKRSGLIVNKVYTYNENGAQVTIDINNIYFNSLKYLKQKKLEGDKEAIVNFLFYLVKPPSEVLNQISAYGDHAPGVWYYLVTKKIVENEDMDYIGFFLGNGYTFSFNSNTTQDLYLGTKNKTFLNFLNAIAIQDFEKIDKILKKLKPFNKKYGETAIFLDKVLNDNLHFCKKASSDLTPQDMLRFMQQQQQMQK